jgi:hypothetical protein
VTGRGLPVPATQYKSGNAASALTWLGAQSALCLRRLLPAPVPMPRQWDLPGAIRYGGS